MGDRRFCKIWCNGWDNAGNICRMSAHCDCGPNVEKLYTTNDVDKIVDQICEPYGNHISSVVAAGQVLKSYLNGEPPAKDTETQAMEYYSQKVQQEKHQAQKIDRAQLRARVKKIVKDSDYKVAFEMKKLIDKYFPSLNDGNRLWKITKGEEAEAVAFEKKITQIEKDREELKRIMKEFE